MTVNGTLTFLGPVLASIVRNRIEENVGKDTLVMASVTDGGANYANASQRLSGDSWTCCAHRAHLIVQDYFSTGVAAQDLSHVKVQPSVITASNFSVEYC